MCVFFINWQDCDEMCWTDIWQFGPPEDVFKRLYVGCISDLFYEITNSSDIFAECFTQRTAWLNMHTFHENKKEVYFYTLLGNTTLWKTLGQFE